MRMIEIELINFARNTNRLLNYTIKVAIIVINKQEWAIIQASLIGLESILLIMLFVSQLILVMFINWVSMSQMRPLNANLSQGIVVLLN